MIGTIFTRFTVALAFAMALAGCKDRAVAVVEAVPPTLTDLGAAPAWTLTDLSGKTLSSAELAGKVVVVDFWATWCAPCREMIPGYVELHRKYADRGLVVVGISLDQQGEDVVKPFVENFGMTYPVALGDGAIVDAFGGVEYLPTAFLIDRAGQIRHRKIGAIAPADYERLVASLL